MALQNQSIISSCDRIFPHISNAMPCHPSVHESPRKQSLFFRCCVFFSTSSGGGGGYNKLQFRIYYSETRHPAATHGHSFPRHLVWQVSMYNNLVSSTSIRLLLLLWVGGLVGWWLSGIRIKWPTSSKRLAKAAATEDDVLGRRDFGREPLRWVV